MKRFVSLVFILLPLSVFAQHHVSFTYDASGNRKQGLVVTAHQKANSKEANMGSAGNELSTGEVLKVYCNKTNDKIVIRLLKPIDGKCSSVLPTSTSDGTPLPHMTVGVAAMDVLITERKLLADNLWEVKL